VVDNQIPDMKLSKKITFQSGGTRYIPALQSAMAVSEKTHKNFSKIVYYFMSDGHPHDDPKAAID